MTGLNLSTKHQVSAFTEHRRWALRTIKSNQILLTIKYLVDLGDKRRFYSLHLWFFLESLILYVAFPRANNHCRHSLILKGMSSPFWDNLLSLSGTSSIMFCLGPSVSSFVKPVHAICQLLSRTICQLSSCQFLPGSICQLLSRTICLILPVCNLEKLCLLFCYRISFYQVVILYIYCNLAKLYMYNAHFTE